MTISRTTAAAAALAMFAAGAGAAYFWTHRSAPAASLAGSERALAPASPPRDGIIRVPAELVARAGIRVEPATTGAVASTVRVAATVQPNAYRQVSVTALVGGRVTRMLVELGQTVARGAAIAEVYSPEIADARARYLSARADAEAGDARLRRSERLAALGSASQQEVEQVRAEHVRHETEMRGTAARLRLLGIDPETVADARDDATSTAIVRAPQAGLITERAASTGMTVEPSTVLATIADVSPVWIIADVYERDIAQVRVGAPAAVTSTAYLGVTWPGRVTYIAPGVRPDTRTAQVRIEAANADAHLKFGMFVDAAIAREAVSGVTIPAGAVQTIGTDTVVFVREGTSTDAFRERRVALGGADGGRVTVLDGLRAGDPVVVAGSFELRAEAERQGVRPGAAAPAQSVAVSITTKGFEPASLRLQPGIPARVTFTRHTDETCATEIAIPAYGITRALPLDQPVTVEFVPVAGESAFQCGMGMLAGTLVVR